MYSNKKLYKLHQRFYQFLIDEAKKLDEPIGMFKQKKFIEFIKLNKISNKMLSKKCLSAHCFCCNDIGRYGVLPYLRCYTSVNLRIPKNIKCKCLLKFNETCFGSIYDCLGGLYIKFITCTDKKETIKILRKIKNLPIRE
jgi:hypothetical protein